MSRLRRFSPSHGLALVSRRMPLKYKLPLLMSFVLATVLAIALVVTHTTLRNVALSTAIERLARGTRQLATLSSATIPAQHARFLPVANDSTVRRALLAPTPEAGKGQTDKLNAALEKLVLPADSGLPVELWTREGRRVGFVGNDVRAAVRVAPGKPELPEEISTFTETASGKAADSLHLTPLYPDGERVYFWFVMPVKDRGQTLGYLAQQRRIALGPNANRTLRELSGDSVSLYYRNVDGGFWASGTGVPYSGLRGIDTARGLARDSAGDKVLFHEERIGGTPLVVVMAVPERSVVSRPKKTTQTILLLSLLLLLGGTLAAWVIGRNVARPLGDITRAAGALAGGDYNARVPSTGDYEVRRLSETFNHMADEIGTSRAALERQTREAQEANSAKSQFLTTMSHELRTPLNAIGGYVDLLEMELRGPVTETQKKDLRRIKASQQHLLGLISSVLDLSRIESGQVAYNLTPIAVDPFIAGLDALVAPQAAAKSITLEHRPCPPDLAVVADREKLRQVMLNLLSNAIRHTPAGGTISLSAEKRDYRVLIVVEDTGPGIPADKREMIFEPFVQLDRSLTQTLEGLGLGLAISRDLARGMSGDLVVDPHYGRGARFVLTLPIGDADETEPMSMSGETPAYGSAVAHGRSS